MKTKATAVIIIIGFIIAVISCFIAIAATDAPHKASNNIEGIQEYGCKQPVSCYRDNYIKYI